MVSVYTLQNGGSRCCGSSSSDPLYLGFADGTIGKCCEGYAKGTPSYSLQLQMFAQKKHRDAVYTLAVSGDILFSAGSDHSICAWGLPDQALLHCKAEAHDSDIRSLAVNDSIVFSADYKGNIKCWRVTDDFQLVLLHVTGLQRGPAFSIVLFNQQETQEGKHTQRNVLVASGWSRRSEAFLVSNRSDNDDSDVDADDIVRLLPLGISGATAAHRSLITCSASDGSDQLITGSMDRTVRLWSLPPLCSSDATLQFTGLYYQHDNPVLCVGCEPHLFSCCSRELVIDGKVSFIAPEKSSIEMAHIAADRAVVLIRKRKSKL